MSLTIPDSVIPLFTKTIFPFLKTEAEKVANVSKFIDSTTIDLDTIKNFLKKVERKECKELGSKSESESEDVFMKRVIELKFKMEDILDDYELLEQRRKFSNQGCFAVMNKVKYYWEDYEIACNIGRLKKALEVKDNKSGKTYHEFMLSVVDQQDDNLLSEYESESVQRRLQDPGKQPLYRDKAELEGVDDKINEIVELLDLEDNKEKHKKKHVVVAVWGEVGVGKTTVVRKVYEDSEVGKHFNVCAWISATKPYNRVHLLKCLIRHFHDEDVNKMEDNEVFLTDHLRNFLIQNPDTRYMVVLDDVSEKEDLFKLIKAGLVPRLNEGGRILITTRYERIANYWKAASLHGYTYNLPILARENAKNLFKKKAFGENGGCPWKLEKLMEDIVAECDGLPFLIEKVGALFSTSQKWNELYHSYCNNPLSMRSKKDLLIRYHKMADHLKPCFQYFCMFPKGYEVDRMRMIRLWTAEGFVSHPRNSTLEVVAEDYLNALVEEGMVRATQKDETGRNRTFRLLNIWHQIMLPKLEGMSFCQKLSRCIDLNLIDTQCRRLSMQYLPKTDTTIDIPHNVRSIISFVELKKFPFSWTVPFKRVAFHLKVLDIQDAKFEGLPQNVNCLQSLRYLSLRNTKVEALPASIEDLWNLQILDLKQSLVDELPKEISHLKKLRHFLAGRYEGTKTVPVKIPEGSLQCFEELQKLAYVDGSSAAFVQQLQNFKQLRRLGIANLTGDRGEDLCSAVNQMQELRSLNVTLKENNILDLNHLTHPPPYLERLILEGPLKDLPTSIFKDQLKHLVKLRLKNSELTSDPVKKIRPLLELVVLELEGYNGKELDFSRTGFRKLEVLTIKNLCNLERINAGTKALSMLRKAGYCNCPKLIKEKLPDQIFKALPQDKQPSNSNEV